MKPLTQRVLRLVVTLAMAAQVNAVAADDANKPSKGEAERLFIERVEPLLARRCIACHGSEKAEGGLRLDSRKAMLVGGNSGPTLIPGKPDESLLLMAVKRTHESLEMPPKEELSAREIGALERWIQAGAPWPQATPTIVSRPVLPQENLGDAWTDSRNPIVRLFGGERLDLWSLKPVKRPDAPEVQQTAWAKQDLDRFVLSRWEADGVSPPAMADSRTLARRLYFDLIGLPPTPEQLAAFENAASQHGAEEAASALVDELLASPHFGEHFARMWLDVARYSDSNGFDWDEFRPEAWRYRDYVIRSLNADKPYNQFIREQLAGDELFDGPPKTPEEQDCLIATGFLRLGPHDNAAKLFDEQDRSRAELLADVTETTAGAFLGLTMSCCRCHDHKYDPISQADHYRFRAFFAAMQFADDMPVDLADEQADIKQLNTPIDEQAKSLREKLNALPETSKAEREELEKQISEIEKQRRPFAHALLMTDNSDTVAATYVLFQGDHKSPRDAVEPGFLSVFDPQLAAISKAVNSRTTGRRMTLANWIASPQNPLTARVFVNRIWQSLMGRALVATPNDFGLAGAAPEDAELLDWLADEFVRDGWSVKRLVRRIATSATYQQAPTMTAEHFALRSPRRLTAEQLRDSLLYVSGLLTSKSDGPPIWPDLPADVLDSNPAFLDDNPEKTKGWYPSPKADQYCRSVFLVQKRNTRVPLLETFDLPDNSTSCARRDVSTVAPQALSLLNNSLMPEAAQAFAERVERDAGNDRTEQVRQAFTLALQRAPDDSDLAACLDFLHDRSLTELCRAILNLNEFVYVD